jgi:hypothetical protein
MQIWKTPSTPGDKHPIQECNGNNPLQTVKRGNNTPIVRNGIKQQYLRGKK